MQDIMGERAMACWLHARLGEIESGFGLNPEEDRGGVLRKLSHKKSWRESVGSVGDGEESVGSDSDGG